MDTNRLVKEELSGSVAKAFVAQIIRFNRVQASTMFHEAAEYVKGELIRMGLKDAVIEQFPADGRYKYWTHVSPISWTARSAELRLIEPEEKLLATYEDIPQCLYTYSKGTPPEGVTAELVDVGAGTKPKDYEGIDVKGKFVLATGRGRLAYEHAVYEHGAAALITDTCIEFPDVRESLDIPDAHAYQSIWPAAEDLPRVTFGFSISKRQGNQLRALLKKGKPVKLKATVDAELFPGKLDVVTATIPGSTKADEEIFIVAHLCHPKPSANDNASGSGLLLEIARTITTLINTGRIKLPARTIRLFWVPETFGSVAYLAAHEATSKRLVAGINLDMVGENQEFCKSVLTVDRTPDSCPSYLNDFVFSLIEQSVKEFDKVTAFGSSSIFRYRTTTFSAGSDHAEFADATTGVPCIMLLEWPDLYYHTSMDTIDKVSEDTLKRTGWVTTVAVLTLANASAIEALLLASETATRGAARIGEIAREAVEELFKKKDAPKLKDNQTELGKELSKVADTHRNKLEHAAWREQEATKSVTKLGESPELKALIDKYCKDIADLGWKELQKLEEITSFLARTLDLTISSQPEETQAHRELKALVPKRLFKGTMGLDLKRELGEKEYEWYEKARERDAGFFLKLMETFNFMNGKRTAYDIMKAISAEYNEISPEDILKILHDMEKLGLITFA